MKILIWCQGINNSLGLPVSQQWGQNETDTLVADTSCILDAHDKSHPCGTLVSQVQVRACGLSSNTAGNGWPEGPPHHSSPALLLSAPSTAWTSAFS